MTWREFVHLQIVDYCNARESRTFSLRDLLNDRLAIFRAFRVNNRHVEEKVRQQLQVLRDKGLVTFLDNSGHYTLRGVDLLDAEKTETQTIDLSKETAERREYLIETYVRNVAWARKAREVLGDYCIMKCSNTFLRDDGRPYAEVHHIVPLCRGGEDGLWNLSVLCAHHHRMAHYADSATRLKLEGLLLDEVRRRI